MSNQDGKFTHSDGVSLKEYIDTRIRDIERATDLAANHLSIRLESLNEWRLQNKDERNCYVTKVEYEANHKLLEVKIEALQKLVWIGVGGLFVIEIALNYFNK